LVQIKSARRPEGCKQKETSGSSNRFSLEEGEMTEPLNKAAVYVHMADGTTIKGLLNIGKYNRLSDFLNSKDAEPFLIVYDASMDGKPGKVVIINRSHIAWAAPE